jgi:hypothetical protein
MVRKIQLVLLLGILAAFITGCGSSTPNIKLFTAKSTVAITIEESMPLYKNMDIHSPILETLKPGDYKVLDAVDAKDDKGSWIYIESKGVKGYILGTVVKK